ncbi:hypothetical protein IWQ56_002438 [Coemansia nantahalensis]|uniref:Uncharacterized protein n=2 Tax=Coemansia TaxID=4863 RepID=A0ACC1LIE9_9FUNG|nr:hypothetical protein IWQ56_002438 [Coemansia nantahalensis]KAJ2775567.1 hypothetical protein IWQ57_000357 [Coemansia nantahalensis]KAJ2808228.1 hypothetical protein H4R21_000153 [Coemansia helicoidea]
MFKKPFQTKPRAALRSTGCRQLAQEAQAAFPLGWAQIEGGAAAAETPMPDKLQTAKFTSHVGDRGEIIYSETGNPLWVKAELHGSGEATLVPTVYTQWRFPGLLPVVRTWASVVDKLVGGADLMTAGLLVPEGGMPDLKKGTVVAICCPGGRAALAIGILDLDTAGIRSTAGAKGKAVLVVHTFGDCLWEAGDKSSPPANDGSDKADDGGDGSNVDSGDDGDGGNVDGEDSVAEEPTAKEAPDASPAETDSLLMTTLKQVMATVLDAAHAPSLLPITSSVLYSGYMVPNAPAGASIDIKRSSYKKLGKFLKAAEKHGLLQLKDIRGESHIKSLNWAHKDLVDYKPYRVRRIAKSAAAGGGGGAAEAAAETGASGGDTISIAELLKPPQALAPLFDAVGVAPPSGYYTRQQARGVLEDYIRSRSLADPTRPRDVRIDHLVCDGLLTKSEAVKLTTFPRDKLHARLQESMTLYTRLSIPEKVPVTRPGPPPSVDVVCERRMGNKVVTRALGLEAYGIDPAEVAKELRTMCASSTAVDPVPGKKGAQAALVQGHHVAALTKLLARHGLPAELIRVTDKSGKAPKKQPQPPPK